MSVLDQLASFIHGLSVGPFTSSLGTEVTQTLAVTVGGLQKKRQKHSQVPSVPTADEDFEVLCLITSSCCTVSIQGSIVLTISNSTPVVR